MVCDWLFCSRHVSRICFLEDFPWSQLCSLQVQTTSGSIHYNMAYHGAVIAMDTINTWQYHLLDLFCGHGSLRSSAALIAWFYSWWKHSTQQPPRYSFSLDSYHTQTTQHPTCTCNSNNSFSVPCAMQCTQKGLRVDHIQDTCTTTDTHTSFLSNPTFYISCVKNNGLLNSLLSAVQEWGVITSKTVRVSASPWLIRTWLWRGEVCVCVGGKM